MPKIVVTYSESELAKTGWKEVANTYVTMSLQE